MDNNTNNIIELTYLSRATQAFSEEALIALLEHARTNNAKRNITGILLFDGESSFIQVLEGPKEEVEKLYEIIKSDPRHDEIYQLGSRDVSQRTFTHWQMGFKNLRHYEAENIPGYTEFLRSGGHDEWQTSQTSFAVQMLQFFKDEYVASNEH
jgi:hypothetical protein